MMMRPGLCPPVGLFHPGSPRRGCWWLVGSFSSFLAAVARLPVLAHRALALARVSAGKAGIEAQTVLRNAEVRMLCRPALVTATAWCLLAEFPPGRSIFLLA